MSERESVATQAEPGSDEAASTLPPNVRERVAAAVVGLVLLAFAVRLLWRDGGDAALLAVVVLGGALVFLALVGDRLTSFRFSDLELVSALREKAKQAGRQGQVEEAAALHVAADIVASPGRFDLETVSEKALLELVRAALPEGVLMVDRPGAYIDALLLRQADGKRVGVEVAVGPSTRLWVTDQQLRSTMLTLRPPPDAFIAIAPLADSGMIEKLVRTPHLGVPVVATTAVDAGGLRTVIEDAYARVDAR